MTSTRTFLPLSSDWWSTVTPLELQQANGVFLRFLDSAPDPEPRCRQDFLRAFVVLSMLFPSELEAALDDWVTLAARLMGPSPSPASIKWLVARGELVQEAAELALPPAPVLWRPRVEHLLRELEAVHLALHLKIVCAA